MRSHLLRVYIEAVVLYTALTMAVVEVRSEKATAHTFYTILPRRHSVLGFPLEFFRRLELLFYL